MMRVSKVKRTGGASFRELTGIKEASRRVIRQTMFATARDVDAEARRAIEEDPKTGPVYRNIRIRPGGSLKAEHRASGPGETHADLSKRTKKSISWKIFGGTKGFRVGYGVAVGRNKMPPHAKYLEDGTKVDGKVRMEPRPTLLNAINKKAGQADKHFKRESDKELR